MQLIQLQKELSKLDRVIFTLNDVVKLTGQKKEIVKVFLSNQVTKNKIYRIKRNQYSFEEITNKFQLAKLYPESYLALNSALEFYETTTQQYNTIELISKKSLLLKKVSEIRIRNHKVREELFFGYEKKTIDNIEFFVSNIEKTIIDCIYFSNKVYLSEVLQFIRLKKNELDKNKIIQYLDKIHSSVLTKRTGYLLELENIIIKDIQINSKYEKLNKNLSLKGSKNKKWKLIVNEEL